MQIAVWKREKQSYLLESSVLTITFEPDKKWYDFNRRKQPGVEIRQTGFSVDFILKNDFFLLPFLEKNGGRA